MSAIDTPFTSARIALTTFPGWGAVSGAFMGGYKVGTAIYNRYDTQILDAIDYMTDSDYNSYCEEMAEIGMGDMC
ncbi:MAG: hypothetical protein P8179_19765 [Candidatus Thiodiazotropha sp.]|jgi:hypothetical protein